MKKFLQKIINNRITNASDRFTHIENMMWREVLKYCIENNVDSITAAKKMIREMSLKELKEMKEFYYS